MIIFYTKEKDENKALKNLERAMQTIEKEYIHSYDKFFTSYKGLGYIYDGIERPDSLYNEEELKVIYKGFVLICADDFSDGKNFIGYI